MKLIKLANSGKYATVDDADYEFLSQWKWRLSPYGYACRRSEVSDTPWVLMHRLITSCPKGKEVDHVNHDRLDNTRSNLRICSKHENRRNRPESGKYRYRGARPVARKTKPRFIAEISHHNKSRHIGLFDSEHHAALAYDLWATTTYGKFANTNFEAVFHGP